ncbi:MAG: hypothetical protein GXO42_01850 [bacterium]|nr:hypothetical protein [bacterium]
MKGRTATVKRVGEVAVKELRPDSPRNNLEKEFRILERLAPFSVAPRPIRLEKGRLYMEYIPGLTLKEFLKQADRQSILIVLQKLLHAAALLDLLGIAHTQLHIGKNVLVMNNAVKIIDFEKAIENTPSPGNVGQVCGYYLKKYLSEENFEKVKELVRQWKKLLKELHGSRRH